MEKVCADAGRKVGIGYALLISGYCCACDDQKPNCINQTYRMTKLLTAALLSIAANAFAQIDSVQVLAKPKLTFGGFMDTYYLYDINQPTDRERPPFVYQYSRHDEINLNLAVLSATYESERVRGNLGLQTGTYVQRNLAAEELNGSEVLKFIYQANVGIRLAKELWLDVGILPSHIGYESTQSIHNPTLTRSMMADNTPYFETGAKLTWEVNDKLTLSGLVLNGWQRILETDNNKALGTQIQYKPVEGILLSSSTFFGKEGTNRYFHNFYAVFDGLDRFTFVTAFDIGWQQLSAQGITSGYQTWWNPNIIVQYKPLDQFAVAGRIEYYHDPGNVIIPATVVDGQIITGFETWSPSLNVDYYPVENAALRLEGRLYQSKNNVFIRNHAPARLNALVATSLSIRF